MIQTLDRNIPHRLQIKLITLATKVVNLQSGPHSKYDIQFEGGYKAELLQPQGNLTVPAQNGQAIHFSIDHRNQYGDQISIIPKEQYDAFFAAPKPIQMSMSGSSRVIALTCAVQTHNMRAQVDGVEHNTPEKIVATAKFFESYLLS